MNAGPAPFAIVGAAVLDGTGGPVLPGGRTVLVRDGRIAQVGPAGAVAVPGGYPSHAAWAPAGTAREVDGPDQAAAAAADLAAAGASVVKVALDARVGPTLPAETLAAAVRAARRRGLGVTAHVAGRAEVEKALATGVTELAHWP